MRKIMMLGALALILTACSSPAAQDAAQTGTSEQYNAKKSAEVPTPIESNNEAQPQSSAKQEETKPETIKQDKSMNPDQSKFEDLVKEYTRAVIKTNLGDITVEFYGKDSPKTVNNFLNLAKLGFYDGTRFHRVIKDFMIQGGDPNSKSDDWSTHGTGGPSYRFADEFNSHKLVKGSLAMANAGPNTNGSQFFIVTAAETPWLNGLHTNFGQVTEGMDVVAKIEASKTNQNDHPLDDVTINSIELKK
jgi:peptidyl-prolyl cis-trans isomerase B (cyclophilin B)